MSCFFKPTDPLVSNNPANVILESGVTLMWLLSLAHTARRGLPDSPDVTDTLGWIHYQKGAYKNFHSHLGLAYDKDRAVRAGSTALGTCAQNQT